jgi:hypothetical protein
MANIGRKVYDAGMDEGRKRVIGIIAGIIMARNLDRADDLFGGPQGSPRTDKVIAAAVQWAERTFGRLITYFRLFENRETISESSRRAVPIQ